MNTRRAFLIALVVATAGCRGKPEERCATCGMRIDEASTFRAELDTPQGSLRFDSPRCALVARHDRGGGTLHVREFYSGESRDGASVVFVEGSDVLGPMGKDLVPVEEAKADKFKKDHGGTRVMKLAEAEAAAP